MKCEEALLLLSAHIDGQTTPEEERSLQDHLAACASCRALLEDFEQIDPGVADLEEEPPVELTGAVMERVRAAAELDAKPARKRRFIFGPGTAVAAVAAVLLLLVASGKIPNMRMGSAKSTAAGTAEATAETYAAETFAAAASSVPEETAAAGAALAAPYAGEDTAGAASAAASPSNAEVAAETTAAETTAAASASDNLMIAAVTETTTAAAAETADAAAVPRSAGASNGLFVQAEAVHLLIQDNGSALTAIPALAGMDTLTADDGGTDWYVTDVGTAKAMEKEYGVSYPMTWENADGGTADDAICLVRLTKP